MIVMPSVCTSVFGFRDLLSEPTTNMLQPIIHRKTIIGKSKMRIFLLIFLNLISTIRHLSVSAHLILL